ncbi:MAG: glycyl-radical enzyme activating protein [Eubacteriales bacterium]|nr:glycyl-radical enzyme activating protein [Eubacteriales bacterium]
MGMIFDIQRFCMDDGPGIRTVVFMKGCPLDCVWCHNPESKSIKSQTYLDGSKTIGYESTVDQIMQVVLRDRDYYENSGGGLTLSGGEPMFQSAFSYEVLQAAKQSEIHTCMETCGYASQEAFEKILPVTDLFLFDLKAPYSTHKKLIGTDNALILSNLAFLHDSGADIILRCPIVPGLNDTDEHFNFISDVLHRAPRILDVQLMPYHNMGAVKAERLGMPYDAPNENATKVQTLSWERQLTALLSGRQK